MNKSYFRQKIIILFISTVIVSSVTLFGVNNLLTTAQSPKITQSEGSPRLFMIVDGITFQGTQYSHVREDRSAIPVHSVSYAGLYPTDVLRSSQGGTTAVRVQFSDIVVTRYADDTATPQLWTEFYRGRSISSVKFHFWGPTDSSSTQLELYLEITIYRVLISSIASSSVGGDHFLGEESLSFSYGKIEWDYKKSNQQACFDILSNTQC
ncbi:MAG: type VI secretion system tube protein Hcp [Candidatus Hodarchaeales archaeon]|jgi:type VI secretion system Hcp family effector